MYGLPPSPFAIRDYFQAVSEHYYQQVSNVHNVCVVQLVYWYQVFTIVALSSTLHRCPFYPNLALGFTFGRPLLPELGAGISGFWGGVLSKLGSDTYYHFQGSYSAVM